MSLNGKTLFITGASRGIGLAIGLRAAKDGANVVIAAKTAEPLVQIRLDLDVASRRHRRKSAIERGHRGVGARLRRRR